MFDAIVPAGGSARRLDGADKPALEVAGRSLLALVVAAVAGAGEVVVVGPQRELALDRPVRWCREDPPGGGPVAAVAAALPLTRAPAVLVLAADLPAIAPAVPALLSAVDADPDVDVALLVDAGGRRNHLAAAWRRAPLIAALAAVGEVGGAAMRSVVATARAVEVADTGGWGTDCDTWDDLQRARRRHR